MATHVQDKQLPAEEMDANRHAITCCTSSLVGGLAFRRRRTQTLPMDLAALAAIPKFIADGFPETMASIKRGGCADGAGVVAEMPKDGGGERHQALLQVFNG